MSSKYLNFDPVYSKYMNIPLFGHGNDMRQERTQLTAFDLNVGKSNKPSKKRAKVKKARKQNNRKNK